MGPVLPVGARLTTRAREEPPPGELARVYFDRSATESPAKRGGSAGMHRPSSPHRENWAAWVLPQAAKPHERPLLPSGVVRSGPYDQPTGNCDRKDRASRAPGKEPGRRKHSSGGREIIAQAPARLAANQRRGNWHSHRHHDVGSSRSTGATKRTRVRPRSRWRFSLRGSRGWRATSPIIGRTTLRAGDCSAW